MHLFVYGQHSAIKMNNAVKYTINKRHTSHHFILEYLQMRSFHGQTFDIRTQELVDKFTSLTFPNIAYRVEF